MPSQCRVGLSFLTYMGLVYKGAPERVAVLGYGRGGGPGRSPHPGRETHSPSGPAGSAGQVVLRCEGQEGLRD